MEIFLSSNRDIELCCRSRLPLSYLHLRFKCFSFTKVLKFWKKIPKKIETHSGPFRIRFDNFAFIITRSDVFTVKFEHISYLEHT